MKEFLPTPIKERNERGGSSSRRSDAYDATPATAADETSPLEEETGLSPLRSNLYEETHDLDEIRVRKKVKPGTFYFSRGSGVYKGRASITGDVI